MPLKQIYSGSEVETIKILDAVTAAKEPILIYWWSPRDKTAIYDLQRVQLPPISDHCRSTYSSNDGSYDCDFIPEHAQKIATFGLKEQAPSVHYFLDNIFLRNMDYNNMLARVDTGDDLETVASDWVDENEAIWRQWLESTTASPTESKEVASIETASPVAAPSPGPSTNDATKISIRTILTALAGACIIMM